MTDSNKAFIFDMDGTLVDNMHHHTDAWRVLLEENGVPFDERKFLVETAGKTNKEILPTVFGDVSDEKIAEFALRKEDLYRERYLPHRQPMAGLIDFLTAARSLGIKLAVSTAASPRNMDFILDGLDLRQYFDALTTAADVKNGKPDPETFLISAEKVGATPINCIVFEDAFGGFLAAKNAGMKCIGMTTVNTADEIMATGMVAEVHADFSTIDPADLVARYLSENAVTA